MQFSPEEIAWAKSLQQPQQPSGGISPDEIAWAKSLPQEAPKTDFVQGLTSGIVDAGNSVGYGVGKLVAQGVDKVFDTNLTPKVDAAYKEARGLWDTERQQHPIANVIGQAGFYAPTAAIGGGIPGATATAAAISGLQYVPGDDPMDNIKNAGIGALAGGTLGLAAKGVGALTSRLAAGTKAAFTNADDYVNTAVSQALTKPISSADDAAKALQDGLNGVQKKANMLYSRRDALAEKFGEKVTRSNLSELLTKTKAADEVASTLESKELMSAAKDALGNGKELPYKIATDIISKNRAAASKFLNQPSVDAVASAKAAAHNAVADALERDITMSVNHPEVLNAHQAATNFYRDVLMPYKKSGIQAGMERYTDAEFFKNFVRTAVRRDKEYGAFNQLAPEAQDMVYNGYIAALKDSATAAGKIDIDKFSQSLKAGSTQAGKVFTRQADALESLNEIMKAKVLANKAKETGGFTNLLAGSGVIGGGIAGSGAAATTGAALYAVPKMWYLGKAGNMLRNPKSRLLLDSYKNGSDSVRNVVSNKIGEMLLKDTMVSAPAIGIEKSSNQNSY